MQHGETIYQKKTLKEVDEKIYNDVKRKAVIFRNDGRYNN